MRDLALQVSWTILPFFLNNGEEPAKIPVAAVKHVTMKHPMDVEFEGVFECPKPQDHYNQARKIS